MSLLLPRFSRTCFHFPLKSVISLNSLSCISSHNVKTIHQGKTISKFSDSDDLKRNFHTCSQRLMTGNSPTDAEKMSILSSQMNIRLINENSFLSWCRNAYLSTVVGVAMMEQAASTLAQGAGFGAFLIGGMNLLWGTGCHITNLIRLRHVAGMSTFTLTLNVCGSLLHFLLYLVVLVFYMGFLDERSKTRSYDGQSGQTDSSEFTDV